MAEDTFAQLVDLMEVRQLLEFHHRLSGLAYGLLDAAGNNLLAVGLQDICVQFHRAHPVGCQRCRESKASVKEHLPACGEDILEYRCQNGMIDIALPIVIAGVHRATFFVGQFFYADTPPDPDLFRAQAEKFGFDTNQYLEALGRVPVFSREYIRSDTLFLHAVVKSLARCGYSKLRLTRETKEHQRVEEQLCQHEGEFRSLVENALDPIIRYDRDGRRLYVNPAIERLSGKPAAGLIGSTVMDGQIVPKPVGKRIMQYIHLVLATGRPLETELELADSERQSHFFLNSYAPEFGRDGLVKSVLSVSRNITERKRVDELQRGKREQLAAMAVELSLAEDRERRRIAAELHDHIGQTLLLGRIKLGTLAETFESDRDQETYEEIKSLLDRTIRDVRSLTQQLHPPVLASVGLEAALEWLARRMEADYSLRVEFLDDLSPKPLTEELAAVVYQAARELLINVAKHAETGKARLTLGREADMFLLTVRDQGAGFTCVSGLCATMESDCSFGLFNIRQRIKLLGGEVTIKSVPGQGTCATIRVPLAMG